MLENITFLTGRRSYEFRPDDLRLSTLSIRPVQEAIQELFKFQSSTIGTPMPTFGEVSLTFPPGLVFNNGVWQSLEGKYIAIRFLHFEPRRIVVDVAGSSATLHPIFEQLYELLNKIETVDGVPLVKKPQSVLDYSEISATFPFPLETIIPQSMRNVLAKISKEPLLLPTVVLQAVTNTQTLTGTAVNGDNRAFTFAPRAGYQADDRMYFSGAPLDSTSHLNYLVALEEALR